MMVLTTLSLLITLITVGRPAVGENHVRWDLLDTEIFGNDTIMSGYQLDENGTLAYIQYVGRIASKNAILPGRILKMGFNDRGSLACTVSEGAPFCFYTKNRNRVEVAKAERSQVLWVPATRGLVPARAVKGGITAKGEILYVCRAADDTKNSPDHIMMYASGYLQPSEGVCTIEWYGARTYQTYEVLTLS